MYLRSCLVWFSLLVNVFLSNNAKNKDNFIRFSSKDLKIIELAKEEQIKAQKLEEEAENLQNYLSTYISDLSNTEKKTLENKIKNKKLEALELKIKSKKLIYETYASKIYQFWTKFNGKPEDASEAYILSSQARDEYISATMNFETASKTKDFDKKVSLLKLGIINLDKALELIEKAIRIYTNIPLEGLKNVNPQQNVIFITNETDSFNCKYNKPLYNLSEANNKEDSLLNINHYKKKFKANQEETNEQLSITKMQTYTKDTSKIKLYWVQIAACRVPLNNEQIVEIIKENTYITEYYENFWYKYRIGPFKKYEEANDSKKRYKITRAFIVTE